MGVISVEGIKGNASLHADTHVAIIVLVHYM